MNTVESMNSHHYFFPVEVEKHLIIPIHQEKSIGETGTKSLIERFNICADCVCVYTVYTCTSYIDLCAIEILSSIVVALASYNFIPASEHSHTARRRATERQLFNALQRSAILNYGCHKDIKVYRVASIANASAGFVAVVVAIVVSTDVRCIYIVYYALDKCGWEITNNRSNACVHVFRVYWQRNQQDNAIPQAFI